MRAVVLPRVGSSAPGPGGGGGGGGRRAPNRGSRFADRGAGVDLAVSNAPPALEPAPPSLEAEVSASGVGERRRGGGGAKGEDAEARAQSPTPEEREVDACKREIAQLRAALAKKIRGGNGKFICGSQFRGVGDQRERPPEACAKCPKWSAALERAKKRIAAAAAETADAAAAGAAA